MIGEGTDPWSRDYGTVTINNQVTLMTYNPNYIKKSIASSIQESFIKVCEQYPSIISTPFRRCPIIVDGGNLVYNNDGKRLITTSRILSDNPNLSEQGIIHQLQTYLSVNQVVILPQEKDETTGHSDGMVSIVGNNVLIMGSLKHAHLLECI